MRIKTAKQKIERDKKVYKLSESHSGDRLVFAEDLGDFFLVTEILKDGNETHQIRLDKHSVRNLSKLRRPQPPKEVDKNV